MSKLWYVREVPSAEPVGPFTLTELRREVQQGRFREALVATDGATAWRPLLSELADEDPVGNAPTAVHAAAVAPPSAAFASVSGGGASPSYSGAGDAPAQPAPPVPYAGIVPSLAGHSQPPPASGAPPGSVPPPSTLSSAGTKVRPAVGSMPPPGQARVSNAALLVLAFVGALFTALVVFGVVLVVRKHAAGPASASQGIVRVVLPNGIGTGFFVAGPDELAYVATAYHVVSSGEPILVEQSLDGSGGRKFVQAYPQAEVVAFDADADVAIIRLEGVTADHFHAFPLAPAGKADESVLSYGFPGSSLAHKFGMVSKPGKVLSLVRFPVIDHRTGDVVRSDAVAGLLVSVDIEPGFSGGPTVNEKGEVVGVNVTKDLAHRGQNGAVDVSVLRDLLTHVTRADAQKEPTADDVKGLLARIEREYLLLPMDRRRSAREDDLVSASDLPRVGELITTIRRLEIDTSRKPDGKLSGAAGLGLVLARLPGRPLETYRDRSTQKAMGDCEVRERGLREFFGAIASSKGSTGGNAAEEARAKCSELAFRPLVWDLTSLAVQWEGQPRDIVVSKVEVVDPDRHIYRAAVRFGSLDHLVDVWLGTDGGRLRIKVFDADGEASGLATGRQVQASAFAGTWRRSDPRIAHNVARGLDSDMETEETLAVAMGGDGTASITHQFHRKLYFTGARRLACGGNILSLGMEQSFSGSLDNGTITATRSKDARGLGSDTQKCPEALGYAPDLVVVLKLAADKLLVYRTGGAEYPEVAEFTREL